jgi:hypothetical protein
MKNLYYIIKSYLENKEKFYYINIRCHKYHDEINFGGFRKNCFEAIIYKNLNKGDIKMIQNHKDCSLYENLKHGNETINFLQNCITFLFHFYENLQFLELTDNSFIYCKEGKLSLSDFYTVKYGFTWYESYLDVRSSKDSKEFIKLIKNLYKKKLNEPINLSKEEFLNKYYLQYLKKPKDIKLVGDLYEKNITLKDYLEKFFNKNIDYFYYIPIFNKIIGNNLKGIEWILKKKIY